MIDQQLIDNSKKLHPYQALKAIFGRSIQAVAAHAAKMETTSATKIQKYVFNSLRKGSRVFQVIRGKIHHLGMRQNKGLILTQ